MPDAVTTEAAPPTGPMLKDPITGHAVSPYIGADPPIQLASDAPTDRGDAVVPPKDPAATQAAPAETTTPPTKEEPKPGEADPPPERDAQGRFVSKSRFNEVNERRRAAEEKLAQIEREKAAAGKAAETAYDFAAKEQLYIEMILDGKTKEAAELRLEIRAAEQAMYEKVAVTKATEQSRAATVEDRINATAQLYETTYPQFNPESPEYNEELLEDLNAVYTGLIQSKRFPNAADAFQAAISKAMKMHGIAEKDPAAPAASTTPSPPERTAIKRIDAIKNQPPSIARAGNGSADHGDSNIRVAELSEADFARLPEATRRRLRGDNL